MAVLGISLLLASPNVRADAPRKVGPGARRIAPISAVRVDDHAIELDGRVDEAEWLRVPILPKMVQIAPRYGKPVTHDSEIRVAYGQKGLYVAFVGHDEHDQVLSTFARKDNLPENTDKFGIEISPNDDGTNGFGFVVNPAGAQADAQISRDQDIELLWDGVWRANARKLEHGWSAELFVPWSTLRFDVREQYTFGINVTRWVAHEAEFQSLSPPPQGLPGQLSYSVPYAGVRGISPGLNLELRPFASTRFAIRRPDGTLDHSARVLPNAGLDVKYGIRGNLTLDLAVNPDFGQAEVDAAVLNLLPFEVFFPEKRQFFLESKEIFETRFQLFYSRRVGAAPRIDKITLPKRMVHGNRERGQLVELDPQTRILSAVRLTGELAPGWRVGALTATTGPTFGVQRFSDGTEQPIAAEPISQYTAIRLRRQFDSLTYVGGMVTNVARFGAAADAITGGVDYQIRFRERWTHGAQIIGTYDGRDVGMGASSSVERTSKHTAIGLSSNILTPSANFNDIGYMRFPNYASTGLTLAAFNAQPLGPLRNVSAWLDTNVSSTFDGLLQEKFGLLRFSLATLKLWSFTTFAGGHLPRYDIWETRGDMPYLVPLHWFAGMQFSSPFNRRVSGFWGTSYGEQNGRPGPDVEVGITLRPLDRLALSASVTINTYFDRPRWTTRSDLGEPIFGRADWINSNAELRATLGILPTLTLQSYNQLLYSTAHHDAFWVLDRPDKLVPVDPAPYYGVVDQALTSLTSNSILRWEYLPGSFLFVAYTHRTVFGQGGMVVRYVASEGLTNLVADGASHEDVLFIKLSHLFGL